MENTNYFNLPGSLVGSVAAEPVRISPTDSRAELQSIARIAGCIAPGTNVPMGYSLHFIISHTTRSPDDAAPGLSSDALYEAFRNYVPNAPRILNVDPESFNRHLCRWANATGLDYAPTPDRAGAIDRVFGITFREKPLSSEGVRAYVEGMIEAAR